MRTPSEPNMAPGESNLPERGSFPWEGIKAPGLTTPYSELMNAAAQLSKEITAYSYRKRKAIAWIVIMGGTGTGKSTIFNILCGRRLSGSGVERPKTCGPIVYAHRNARVGGGLPFPEVRTRCIAEDDESPFSPHSGTPGELLVIEHGREEIAHLAFVDTPDLDSLEPLNREMAEDVLLLSDAVVFVMSQEKYADEAPFRFLRGIHEEEKPYHILLNKADLDFTRNEALEAFRAQGLHMGEDLLWLLPYTSGDPQRLLSEYPQFREFRRRLFQTVSKDNLPRFLREGRRAATRTIDRRIAYLADVVRNERTASLEWLEQLESLAADTGRKLLAEQRGHFTVQSRECLQQEIRLLFARYDVLARPRRAIAEIVTAPLRMMGIIHGKPAIQRQVALTKLRRRIDLAPLRGAIMGFNRLVIERLSPATGASPLKEALRRPGLALTDEEIEQRAWDEQERLVSWLDDQFDQLAKGIPRSKEFGIYSTSVLWGILILSLEAAIGGGLSLIEVVLDSAIAPFVTKGAMELFARAEIQRVARELALRYEKGLLAIIDLQRNRYAEVATSLTPSPETIGALEAMRESLRAEGETGGMRK